MSSKVRVLYLTISGDRFGGAEIQYEQLIAGLDRSRYDPILGTPAWGELNSALARDGISTCALSYPMWRRKEWLGRRRARSHLVAFARKHRVHLVHGDFDLGPYLVAIGESLGVPSVLHVRQTLRRGWVRRYAMQRATALIAIGSRYRDQLLSYGIPPERIAVISDAADVVRFTPECSRVLRQEHPAMANDVLFGIVGRIEPSKRQIDFLRAASHIIAAGGRARFFVIGPPNVNCPEYVRRVRAFPSAHGIEQSVRFTGPRTDIEQVIASLDVLVTLSGGSVMLEAMACGIPIVTATDRNPSDLEMVREGETGLVVPIDNQDALVRSMLRLCNDSGLRRFLGANGRQRVEARFSLPRLVGKTASFYESLLANCPDLRGSLAHGE